MAKKGGALFWCRVRGHTLTPDDDPLRQAVWSFADLSDSRPVGELSRMLMQLELKKLVRRLPGNFFERV